MNATGNKSRIPPTPRWIGGLLTAAPLGKRVWGDLFRVKNFFQNDIISYFTIKMQFSDSADELLDLIDDRDRVIGQMPRSQIYQNRLTNFRVVNAFIINAKGQLWIPRRTASKQIFPLALDVSVGGHVKSGEDYEAAFARELEEEVNLKLEQGRVGEIAPSCLGKLSPKTHGVSAFMKVYQIQMERSPRYNTQDFLKAYWLKPQELLAKIEAGENAKDDLPKLVRYFYC